MRRGIEAVAGDDLVIMAAGQHNLVDPKTAPELNGVIGDKL